MDKQNEDKVQIKTEEILVLHANLDDMTGEALGFAQERLWDSGALDVYTTPIFMKKNRPATMLSCICKPEKKMECIETFLRYTTTLGVRIESMERCSMERTIEVKETSFGKIRIKKASYGENPGIHKWKAEYEDLRKIALEHGISLQEVERSLEES